MGTQVPEAFRASLQQCLKAYPLRHLSLQAVSPPASDLLSRIVPQMTWPENCCMLSLHHLSNSASLAALAQQVARDAVAGLTLCVLHSDSVTSEQMLQFLSALNLSQLQSLALDFQLYPMLFCHSWVTFYMFLVYTSTQNAITKMKP